MLLMLIYATTTAMNKHIPIFKNCWLLLYFFLFLEELARYSAKKPNWKIPCRN